MRFAEANIRDPEHELDLPDFLEFLEGFVMEDRTTEQREEIEAALNAAYEGDAAAIKTADGKVTNVAALREQGRVGDLGSKMRAEMARASTPEAKLKVRRKYMEIARKAKAEQEAKAAEGGS